MYLCTQLGFFSITRPSPDVFQIHSSLVNDLEYLSRSIGLPAPVKSHAAADSPWHIACHPSELTRFLALMATTINYSDFESTIDHHPEMKAKLEAYREFQRCLVQG